MTRYANAQTRTGATDTLFCPLTELFNREAMATMFLLDDWPIALPDLRVLLAAPRLDLLSAALGEAEV